MALTAVGQMRSAMRKARRNGCLLKASKNGGPKMEKSHLQMDENYRGTPMTQDTSIFFSIFPMVFSDVLTYSDL